MNLSEPLSASDDRALETLRVLIVDDHDLFRTGLRNLLEEQGVQISGEAASGSEAVRSVRELAPDVVVMDLNMPDMGGVEATRHISAVAPLTRVLVLTISDEDADVMDAILAGACGYLLKDASIEELLEAPASGASAPTLARLEETLTDGYARALALEAERSRIERRIGEVARTVVEPVETHVTDEIVALGRRLTHADVELGRLRTVLVRLQARTRTLRRSS